MPHPFLRWWEVALVRLISRSPRIGLILVKQHSGVLSWVVRDRSDEQPMPVTEVEAPLTASGLEPPSMRFERAFHAPDAER
jgi:hypothetical protein